MKDGLGQEIKVGSTVAWIGGKTQYAGVRKYEVVKINKAQIRVAYQSGDVKLTSSVYPCNVIVLDNLLDKNKVTVNRQEHEKLKEDSDLLFALKNNKVEETECYENALKDLKDGSHLL